VLITAYRQRIFLPNFHFIFIGLVYAAQDHRQGQVGAHPAFLRHQPEITGQGGRLIFGNARKNGQGGRLVLGAAQSPDRAGLRGSPGCIFFPGSINYVFKYTQNARRGI
jgi:hypothetical protein